MIQRKTRFILIISSLLVLGFSATSLISYFVANDSLQAQLRSNTLPLTSDNVYSEIQRDVLPTIVISSLMAQDTFVRDWILAGEKNPDQLVQYLNSVQQRYKTATAFFISDVTRNYYHSSGILKKVSQSDPIDGWYFRVSGLKDDFEINIDIDTANPGSTTVFVNHKVIDFEGNYLGAIGVGLSSDAVKAMIERYESRYGRQVYFVDPQGNVTLRGKHYRGTDNIRQNDGLSDIAQEVLNSSGGSYSYFKSGNEVFLESRFVSELGWHLLVEQVEKPEFRLQKTLWINLGFSFLITVIVLLIVNFTIKKYQQRLEIMATQDKLTGTDNRHAFEPSFERALKFSDRRKEPLSLVLVDIDHFKQVNDKYGHLTGDGVIAGVAAILRANLRDTDLICRWGGEEFLILLTNCDQDSAKVLAEKLRHCIDNEGVEIAGKSISVTASFGVSSYQGDETQSEIFDRADKALYRAKDLGRNQVEVS